MKGGAIVDATLISAPYKNASGSRDPEIKRTKKENEWHFRMKCNTGADAETGYIHSIEAMEANVHHITEAVNLIRRMMKRLFGWTNSLKYWRTRTSRKSIIVSLNARVIDVAWHKVSPGIGIAVLSTKKHLSEPRQSMRFIFSRVHY